MGGVLRVLWSRTWEPEINETYYIPSVYSRILGGAKGCSERTWLNDADDNILLGKGMVFKTPQEAISVADKMLEILKEDQ